MDVSDSASDSSLNSLPFSPMLPVKLKLRDLSVRPAGDRWTSLRFLVDYNKKVFRVKEFFMDWFYTGFPKSLMKSLVDVYEDIVPSYDSGRIWFYGKNYKGLDSAAMYLDGTSVEIECYSKADIDEFRTIINDLGFYGKAREKLADVGFSERSFLATGKTTDWWEDVRISLLKWHNIRGPVDLAIGPVKIPAVSYGIRKGKDGSRHRMLILAEKHFSRVVWLDVVEESTSIEHAFYNFREKKGLFDSFTRNDSLICRRTPYGPSVVQRREQGLVITLSFSPSFSEQTVVESAHSIGMIMEQASKLIPAFGLP